MRTVRTSPWITSRRDVRTGRNADRLHIGRGHRPRGAYRSGGRLLPHVTVEEVAVAHLPHSVHRLLAAQHGVVSTGQLRSAGLSESQIKRLDLGGSLDSFLRGTYRSPSWPVDELMRCAAICLGRPQVAIAGPTAGRLWGFRRLPADRRVHVIAPPAQKPTIERWVRAY